MAPVQTTTLRVPVQLRLATILGAVLVSQSVAGWIVGLAVGLTSVILAAVLWSSRQL